MNKPYFSVIIPTLNEEKYLPKLLKDLVSQTYRDFEVVLVDGNSDDKTVEGFKDATTWISADSNKSIDKTMALLANLGQELSKVINKPLSGGFNTIVTKEVFEKVHGYREDLKINEDQDLAIRVYKKGIDVVILQEPKVIFSYRRYRSEGRLTVLRKYAKAIVHLYLKGPITHELFEYEMGGHVHRKRPRKINFAKLNTYLAAIEKLEKKVVKILSE